MALEWLKTPAVLSTAAFLVSCNANPVLLGPTTCNDGWHSVSIGSRGACSHHGGVDRSHGFFGLRGGGVAAWLAYASAQRIVERRAERVKPVASSPAPLRADAPAPSKRSGDVSYYAKLMAERARRSSEPS